MENSPTQVYVKQSVSDEILIRIKEMERKISERFSVEEGISEVNAKNVAEAYGVSNNIANIMLDHNIGDFNSVAKLVFLEEEGASFIEMNNFSTGGFSYYEFKAALNKIDTYGVEFRESNFKDDVNIKFTAICNVNVTDPLSFSQLISYLPCHDDVKDKYNDFLPHGVVNPRSTSREELANILVLIDNNASKKLVNEVCFNSRKNNKFELLNEGLSRNVNEEMLYRAFRRVNNLTITEDRYYELLNELDGSNIAALDSGESDIRSLTDNISATLDNRELVNTNVSSPYSNPLESLGNMLAVS
ncbi:hypothetical protein [Yersinia aldovae]|uniref:hypothetical protein n=1 Tax=Yersinia aldovae TaxID=29483 RepID=UPI0005AD422E|nr:hypothetical protein [Yersinia aldovae]AJJ63406.1 hypothetical protein AT01_3276 [Yersinia aldovae 670-83]